MVEGVVVGNEWLLNQENAAADMDKAQSDLVDKIKDAQSQLASAGSKLQMCVKAPNLCLMSTAAPPTLAQRWPTTPTSRARAMCVFCKS